MNLTTDSIYRQKPMEIAATDLLLHQLIFGGTNRVSYNDVGYLWARFVYFQVRVILQPIPDMVTLVSDRAQRALSIPLITLFFHCPLSP